MANNKQMDPEMRLERIRGIRRLVGKVPSEHIPALEHYILSLLPEPVDNLTDDPEILEIASEVERRSQQRSILDSLDAGLAKKC